MTVRIYRRTAPRQQGEPTNLTQRCACGRPIDAGWTVRSMHAARCLICETERAMQGFDWTREGRRGTAH